jgi:nucleoside 2-deoxyribosyltransferase
MNENKPQKHIKIYLAARYSRREELCGYRSQLQALGYTVTSRWLNGNHQISDDGLSAQAKEEERIRFAQEDWEDLMNADVCISFTEEPRSSNSRGGRHVEFGAALAAGKPCIVVGPRENVFHCLPQVIVYDGFWRVLALLECAEGMMAESQTARAADGTGRRRQALHRGIASPAFAVSVDTRAMMTFDTSVSQRSAYRVLITQAPDIRHSRSPATQRRHKPEPKGKTQP